MNPQPSTTFPESNRASKILAELGNGIPDADFAREMTRLISRCQATGKRGSITLTVAVAPRDDMGCLEVRCLVKSKCPENPPPATQMHVDGNGALLTQLSFLMGGGRDETAPAPLAPKAQEKALGGALPSVAPLASTPAPAPLKA